MRTRNILSAALAALPWASASAQEPAATHGTQIVLPAACDAAAAGATDTSHAMHGMDGAMPEGTAMPGSPAQAEDPDMRAMMAMQAAMMTAMTIEDADLAFNCGMIAHHKGAIAMAEIELATGKDEASKTLARTIIDAQEKEIAEMTAWVEANAK